MTFHLEHGRPASDDGRMGKEIRTYDYLERLGIEYDRIDHEALDTMEACAEADRVLGAPICKNLLLRNQQKTKFYLLMMPGDKKFKTKELSKQINSARLSFAEPEFMERFLDITPGSLSVLGLMNDRDGEIQLLIDEDVLKSDLFGCHPCINTSSLKIRISDLLTVFLPAVGHEPVTVHLVGEPEE